MPFMKMVFFLATFLQSNSQKKEKEERVNGEKSGTMFGRALVIPTRTYLSCQPKNGKEAVLLAKSEAGQMNLLLL